MLAWLDERMDECRMCEPPVKANNGAGDALPREEVEHAELLPNGHLHGMKSVRMREE